MESTASVLSSIPGDAGETLEDADSTGTSDATGTIPPVGGGDASEGTDAGSLIGDAGATDAESPYGPGLVTLFDGQSLNGWVQVPANSWSVVGGAMHSLGTARGYMYTLNRTYGSFRLIFTSRLISDPANHNPCVLFWGNAVGTDALDALQVQPPKGYMWDYRPTSPTANESPSRFETTYPHPNLSATEWSQCEMLANQSTGEMQFACCQSTGTTPCKATEIVKFEQAGAGVPGPIALQVHNARMIEEFKDMYIESPVANPGQLLTTQ
jgi:hypothetical protein